MTDESDNSKVSNTIDAVTRLTKAVPIYDDAFKPIAQETGKALSTVGKTVNMVLLPIRGMVWGAEKIEDWIAKEVSAKLEYTSEIDIVTPDLSIAGPTIEALKYNGHKPELSELFSGLMASAMKKDLAPFAHPTFVEKIKSMTAFDAHSSMRSINSSLFSSCSFARTAWCRLIISTA